MRGWRVKQIRTDPQSLPFAFFCVLKMRIMSRLQALTVGDRFNSALDDMVFPSTLKTLVLGGAFERSLDGVVLPDGLEELILGEKFNRDIRGDLASCVFLASVRCLVSCVVRFMCFCVCAFLTSVFQSCCTGTSCLPQR